MLRNIVILLYILLCHSACLDNSESGPTNSDKNNNKIKTEPLRANYLYSDEELIKNLRKTRALEPKDRGGAGRCLFLSLIDQIAQSELDKVKSGLPNNIQNKIAQYTAGTDEDKADLLREIAIYEEKRFIESHEDKDFKDLSPHDQAWVVEMSKDWHEQFFSRDAARTYFGNYAESASGRQKLWEDVKIKTSREEYWSQTGCATNWAGTSEAIALARLLGRPLEMYGLDLVSGTDRIKLAEDGKVMPYFSYQKSSTKKPLQLIQLGGGGHYQMLQPLRK
jgi:hypothetical protein